MTHVALGPFAAVSDVFDLVTAPHHNSTVADISLYKCRASRHMASYIPIVKDLLPIIMPGDVHVTKASELAETTGQIEGMIRKAAIVGKTNKLCASPDKTLVMIGHPHTSSAVHHHGEQDTIVYAAQGHGTIITNASLSKPSDSSSDSPSGLKRYHLAPGDFALIPAYVEHQEVNQSDEDVIWIITRSGSSPVVVNLEDWGGKEDKS